MKRAFSHALLAGGLVLAASGAAQAQQKVFEISSTTFKDGAMLPVKAANSKANAPNNANCVGENVSPQLSWMNPPDGTKSFVLLMEDVGGRRCYDQMEGCPPEEAARDLDALAAHHAAWWESPDLGSLSWVVRVADPPNPQALVPALRQSWPIIESQFGHLLRGPMFEAARRMPDAVVSLMERLSEPPVTLLHGDHRLDNLFFSDDAGPEGIAVLDWQITGAGRGPYDVAYFLSQSLVPEERKGVEYDLVTAYHRALVARGVTGYSFEDCWEDYCLATLFVCCYPLNAGAVDLVNDRAVALFSTMLDRSVSAILDLDALELMPS